MRKLLLLRNTRKAECGAIKFLICLTVRAAPFALLTMLAAAPIAAADLSGAWDADVDLDAGSGTASFDLKQAGNALSGSYSGQLGEAKVTGTVDGSKVEWSFEASPQGQSIKVSYSGTLNADGTISGKCDYGSIGTGTFKASRRKASQLKPYNSRKLTSMVASTATGFPSLVPGRNRHFSTASTAF